MVTLRARFELENKELKQAQTKKSMEDIRVVQQDKAIKTKAERDRRIKELNEKNVKVCQIAPKFRSPPFFSCSWKSAKDWPPDAVDTRSSWRRDTPNNWMHLTRRRSRLVRAKIHGKHNISTCRQLSWKK